MIKPIKIDERVLELRNNFLRPNHTVEECKFPTDDLTDSLHLGYFHEDEIVAVGSFHRETYQNDQGLGYRIRGLIADWAHKDETYLSEVLQQGLEEMAARGVDYVWVNARHADYKLFEELGFKFLSKEFQIERIGRHRVAMIKLKKDKE